jgi:hypothetical protein
MPEQKRLHLAAQRFEIRQVMRNAHHVRRKQPGECRHKLGLGHAPLSLAVPDGLGPCAGGSKRPLTTIERDTTYPNMWRVRRPNGSLSDMVNRTRAKEAAALMVLSVLNHRGTGTEGGSIRQKQKPGTELTHIREAA